MKDIETMSRGSLISFIEWLVTWKKEEDRVVGWAKLSGKELSNERNKAINFQAHRRLLQYDAVRARLQSLIMESTSEAWKKVRDKHREAVRLQQYYSAKIGVAVERLT